MISSNYFWIGITLIYVTLVMLVKLDEVPVKTFWFGLFASIASIFIVRTIVLKKTLSLSVYDLKHPDDSGLRLFWAVIVIIVIVAFPIIIATQAT